jgi:hypothetical protein
VQDDLLYSPVEDLYDEEEFFGGACDLGDPAELLSMNYRLGRLGFLLASGLAAESPDDVRGNHGYMDQFAAVGGSEEHRGRSTFIPVVDARLSKRHTPGNGELWKRRPLRTVGKHLRRCRLGPS